MLTLNRLFAVTAFSGFIALLASTAVQACGGFFCTTVPINQAGEQIVFHQEGNDITAMVRILYSGEAEDFSWVVPVPTIPEISLGSDVTFNELEFVSRPQFNLEQTGQVCEKDQIVLSVSTQAESGMDESDGGVEIEQELFVGPFDIAIVRSDNPDDMAIWLADNGYLLNDRGLELLEPYVTAGMRFVAVKLRSGEPTGSIQPLIMKYQSDKPMVPIRLTAVAAQDDMGVLVWVVNNARAVPENYEHVIPNYTRLNWYTGNANAYPSYLALITDAMDEAGGQGFATDYAGSFTEAMRAGLTTADILQARLDSLDSFARDALFISQSLFASQVPTAAIATLQTLLPIADGGDTNVYFEPDLLETFYTAEELANARSGMREAFIEREIQPVGNGVALLPAGAYLTRLYTTLSAEEMTVDPTFNYNSDMPGQPLAREALLSASCDANVSNWTLTLGEGTGRAGEVVISATDQPIPFAGTPQPVDDQPAAFVRQRTSADAAPELLFEATSSTVQIAADGSSSGGSDILTVAVDEDSDGFLGALGLEWIALMTLLFARLVTYMVSLRRQCLRP